MNSENSENSRSSMIEQLEQAERAVSTLEFINAEAARKIRAANFLRDLEEAQRGNKEIPLDATEFPETLTKKELKRIAFELCQIPQRPNQRALHLKEIRRLSR